MHQGLKEHPIKARIVNKKQNLFRKITIAYCQTKIQKPYKGWRTCWEIYKETRTIKMYNQIMQVQRPEEVAEKLTEEVDFVQRKFPLLH